MAQASYPSLKQASRHTLTIATYNINDVRVTCGNKASIEKISAWYQELTKQKVKPDKNSKYVNAVVLDDCRKNKVFNNTDWVVVLSDFILSLGYQLIDAGNSRATGSEYTQQKTIMFISSPRSAASGQNEGPPSYTMQ